MMLSALELARRIEAGELTAVAVLDKCAETIAQRPFWLGGDARDIELIWVF